jgi:nucleotide-binding universal stress UspA family protein
MAPEAAPGPAAAPLSIVGRESGRIFLIVVDDTAELDTAIRYASSRARRTGGRVALLYCYEVDREFTHWTTVVNIMQQEARQTAEEVLKRLALRITQETGRVPDMFVREGNRREELFKLVKQHPEISILVLGAAPGSQPGPLVSAVTGKHAGKIGIPVTVVPGELTPAEMDRLATA